MKRLSKEEIEKAKAALCEWQVPEAMLAIAEAVETVTLFNQAGLAFLRDGWVAGEFAKARKADKVRLVADVWPDFQILLGDKVETFEAVEADDPERRRGHEYSEENIGKVEDDPIEDWNARAEAAPGWVKLACERKAKKRYGGSAHLVVYLSNAGEYGMKQNEIKASFFEVTKPAHGVFESVWVLWNGGVIKVV